MKQRSSKNSSKTLKRGGANHTSIRKFSPIGSLLKWMGLMMIWGLLAFFALILWFGCDLPDIAEIAKLPRQPSITILDQKGTVLGSYGDFYGKPITAEALPPHVINILLATEDRRFFSHFGLDILGLVRAVITNMQAGKVVQGGSTLTQQLAKNFLQSKHVYGVFDRSIKRKISEALLALLLERRFTKNQILTMYLNRAFWGSRNYGLDAASLRYFGKHATELGVYETAMLIGMLKGPSRFNPANNPERADGRAKQVLQSTVEAGLLSPKALEEALLYPPVLDSGIRQGIGRYFTDWVVDQLSQVVDVDTEDLLVVTTLDLSLQRAAEKQMQYCMASWGATWKAGNMAMVSMKPNGAIQAMVGGVSYRHSKFNRVTQALRQPGSTFKYFVYLTALENGYSPDSRIADTRVYVGRWSPNNFKYKAKGETTVREGWVHSINTVAVRLALNLGVKRIKAMARRLGITTDLPHNYTLALGTGTVTLLELTGAFSTLANNGWKVQPYGILSVRTRNGTIIYKRPTPSAEEAPVLSQRVVEKMRHIMEESVNRGTSRRVQLPGIKVYSKTGTTQNYRDSWLIAMTSNLVTGVWTGCDNEKPLLYHSGGSPSGHLWRAFNLKALAYAKNPDISDEELLKNDVLATMDATVKLDIEDTEKEDSDEDDAGDEDDDDEEEDDEENDEDKTAPKSPPKKAPSKLLVPPQEQERLIQDILSNVVEDSEE